MKKGENASKEKYIVAIKSLVRQDERCNKEN
jgi:hypothetical protein